MIPYAVALFLLPHPLFCDRLPNSVDLSSGFVFHYYVTCWQQGTIIREAQQTLLSPSAEAGELGGLSKYHGLVATSVHKIVFYILGGAICVVLSAWLDYTEFLNLLELELSPTDTRTLVFTALCLENAVMTTIRPTFH